MNWMADYCTWNCTGYVKNPAQNPGCFRTALEKLNYQNPPYSTHYPEIVNIYDNHRETTPFPFAIWLYITLCCCAVTFRLQHVFRSTTSLRTTPSVIRTPSTSRRD